MLLREYLDNEDLTQEEFALRIGVSRPTISYWMRGLKAPRPEHVMRIRHATNNEVTADDLQFGIELIQRPITRSRLMEELGHAQEPR